MSRVAPSDGKLESDVIRKLTRVGVGVAKEWVGIRRKKCQYIMCLEVVDNGVKVDKVAVLKSREISFMLRTVK